MTLADVSNGPDGILWAVFAVLAVISVMLLSGHGGWFIAGYNTASQEERGKYDEKKLCRVTGVGMAVITVLILIMGLFQNVLPASFARVSAVIVVIDCVLIMIAAHTICRK